MGLIRDKMVEDMKLRGFSEHTQRCYLQYARLFVEHYRRSPSELGENEIRKFLMHLVDRRHAKPTTVRMYVASLKFLYAITLDRPGVVERIPWPKVPKRLPDILSGREVDQILASLRSIKHRAILMIAYGCGLRISEACSLHVTDIDSNRGFIHVRQGKGDKDRYVYRSGNCDPRGVEPRVASPPDGDRRRGGANDGRITRRTDGGLRGVAE